MEEGICNLQDRWRGRGRGGRVLGEGCGEPHRHLCRASPEKLTIVIRSHFWFSIAKLEMASDHCKLLTVNFSEDWAALQRHFWGFLYPLEANAGRGELETTPSVSCSSVILGIALLVGVSL